MRVCLMIEGQEGVTWEHWKALAVACEEHGYEGLFRSDHYGTLMSPRQRGSMDAWTTLGALAAITSRIRLGTLVSPATFRHPSVLAKAAATVDQVSGGRVELGIGAGWNEAEHRSYGFPFPDLRARMDVLEEQVEIVARSFDGEPFSFDGEHYRLEDLDAQPKPLRRPRLPILLGGRAGPRALRIAAHWADEYNTFSASVDQVRERRAAFAQAWDKAGRDPDAFKFSAMVSVLVGADEADLAARASRLAEHMGQDVEAVVENMRSRGLYGTPDQAAERLRELESAGVYRVMLQHFLHDDVDAVELMGRELIPRVRD